LTREVELGWGDRRGQRDGDRAAEGRDTGLLKVVLAGEVLEACLLTPEEARFVVVGEQRAWVEPESAGDAEAKLGSRR
jgi:hypothetical protein